MQDDNTQTTHNSNPITPDDQQLIHINEDDTISELGMTKKQLMVVMLKAKGGKTHKEIGLALNIPEPTVRSILNGAAAQEAVTELTKRRMKLLATEAVDQLTHLMRNARSEKVRLDAINSVLDRAGLIAPTNTAEGLSISGNNVQVNISL